MKWLPVGTRVRIQGHPDYPMHVHEGQIGTIVARRIDAFDGEDAWKFTTEYGSIDYSVRLDNGRGRVSFFADELIPLDDGFIGGNN